jgi:hypothetical protein
VRRLINCIAVAGAIVAPALFCTPATAGCRIDTTAVSAFWEVVETLGSGSEPTPKQWGALLDNPGYDALYANEFEPGFFRECFSIAYNPAHRTELARSLHVGLRQQLFRHYREVLRRRAEIDAAVASLESQRVSERAIERAREFLPAGTPDDCPAATIIVFDYGVRGYDTIILDALKLADTDAEEFFSHEFHHWYRNRLLALDMASLEESDAMAVTALNLLQAEGVADFIDKELWIDEPELVPESQREFAGRFTEAVTHGPDILADVDTLLASFYQSHPDDRAQFGTYLVGSLPLSGHGAGFYMARLIDRQLGRARLIGEIANPFAFVRSYNEAARRARSAGGNDSDAVVLGDAAMSAVSMLEEKYLQK